jgi:hypothetical protein
MKNEKNELFDFDVTNGNFTELLVLVPALYI